MILSLGSTTIIRLLIAKEKGGKVMKTWLFVIFTLGFLFGILLCDLGDMIVEKHRPNAIDVYRGKTTLEITYRDSVAVDSVVVYKMK